MTITEGKTKGQQYPSLHLPPFLVGVVEACLLHMLKRRAAGFLRTDKVAALFTKVGKTYAIAGDICKKVQDLQQQVESR